MSSLRLEIEQVILRFLSGPGVLAFAWTLVVHAFRSAVMPGPVFAPSGSREIDHVDLFAPAEVPESLELPWRDPSCSLTLHIWTAAQQDAHFWPGCPKMAHADVVQTLLSTAAYSKRQL